MLTEKMIEFYLEHPFEFFEDILQVKPTKQQEKLLKSIPESINNKQNISVKAGHYFSVWEKRSQKLV